MDERPSAVSGALRPIRHTTDVLVSNIDKKSEPANPAVRLVNYTDVYYHDVITPDLDLMEATATFDQISRFGVRPGDSIITKDSETPDDIAVPTFVSAADRAMVCGYHLAIVRPSGCYHPKFLNWALRSDEARGQFTIAAKGMTRYGLTYDAIKSVELPVPTLEEQRRIADFLDDQVTRINNTIAARQQQIANLEELVTATAVAQLLGGGRMASSASSEWFCELPIGWRTPQLRFLASVVDCKHRTPTYVEEGFPVVSPGDIGRERLDLSRCNRFVDIADYRDLADEPRRCRRGDIVYSRNASAGSAALVDTDQPFTMGQDVCRIAAEHVPIMYLFYALNFLTDPQLDSARVGSTFTRINVEQIKGLRIPVGPPEEQSRVAQRVDEFVGASKRVAAVQSLQSARLQELKSSVISAAVSGEFDVSSASARGVSA